MSRYPTNEPVSIKTIEHEEKASEYGLTVAKVGVAALPLMFAPTSPLAGVIGIAMSEALGMTINKITGRRQERLEQMLADLSEKVTPEQIREKQDDDNFQQLFMDGVAEAAKAKGRDRLKMIAGIIASGASLNSDTFEAQWSMDVLSGLDDHDLVLLLAIHSATPPYQLTELSEDGYEFFASRHEELRASNRATTYSNSARKDEELKKIANEVNGLFDHGFKINGLLLAKRFLHWTGAEGGGIRAIPANRQAISCH